MDEQSDSFYNDEEASMVEGEHGEEIIIGGKQSQQSHKKNKKKQYKKKKLENAQQNKHEKW